MSNAPDETEDPFGVEAPEVDQEDPSDAPAEVTRVVYGTCQADGILRFIPREVAEDVAQVHVALAGRDWGAFRRALPPGRWEEVEEYHDDEIPADDVSLEDEIPMNADDGCGPAMPSSDASWIPDKAIEIGRFVATALDGAVFGCDEEREAEIVLVLLHWGFELAREDGLVETACGQNNCP